MILILIADTKILFTSLNTCCLKQYTRKSEWPIYFRRNNYILRMKSIDDNKLLPMEEHFCSIDHSFIRDTKFSIIERIK